MPSHGPAYATPAHVPGWYPDYAASTHRAGWYIAAAQAAPTTQYATQRQRTPSVVAGQMSTTASSRLPPRARVTLQPLEAFGFPLPQGADQTLAQPVLQMEGNAYDVYPNRVFDDRPLPAPPLSTSSLRLSPASTNEARDAVARSASSSDAIVAHVSQPPPVSPQVNFSSFGDVIENARTMRTSHEEADRLGREELQQARTERPSAGPSRFHRSSSMRMYHLGHPDAREFYRRIWERKP
ncbi:hypothetical protein GE09DRAFT_187406 [Coniochaeta sp. 2T2.1]|nr:hypothetical protein GE09DRAFT_187406 [Coniochaeta sp. 2T2.1]